MRPVTGAGKSRRGRVVTQVGGEPGSVYVAQWVELCATPPVAVEAAPGREADE